MKYGCVDDCKSKLGKRLMQWRAERPSEWLMDEFICAAEEQHDEIAHLRAEAEALRVANDKAKYALDRAREWLEGWASAVHQIHLVNETISAIDAARGKDNG
jgi:hypothetical protein